MGENLPTPGTQGIMTIDMKSFSGEPFDSAAEGQQTATNTYNTQAFQEDFPEHKQILDQMSAEGALELPETDGSVQDEVESLEETIQPIENKISKQERNFRALTDTVEQLKKEREAERNEFKLQLELLRANLQQQQQPIKREQAAKKLFDGVEDDYIPTVKEIESAWKQRENEYEARLEEMEIAQKHPDYNDVLERYLKPLLQEKPHLAEGIQGARNKALYAYELGKMAQSNFEKQQAKQESLPPPDLSGIKKAEKIVENARKPRTLSQAGGQGSLSKAEYYATMSDKDFYELALKNLGES